MADEQCVIIDGYKYPPGVRLYGWRKVADLNVPILIGSATDLPALKSEDPETPDAIDGWFDPQKLSIYIRAGLRPDHERNAIIHEMVHVFFYVTGTGRLLRTLMEVDADKWEEIEETLVQLVTPHLAALETADKL